ncbi:SPOSA6832_01813, partial [Sporobolomyces salmonicolor]
MVVYPRRGASYPSGYTDLQDHGLIGNMRTSALISISGTVAQLCLPHFDSPSVFARILDKDKGGHFSIRTENPTASKQQYVPRSVESPAPRRLQRYGVRAKRADDRCARCSTNILATKFLSDEGVGQIDGKHKRDKTFLPWLVRHVTTIRGSLTYIMECAPAFDYARAPHETTLDNPNSTATFSCREHLDLDLRWVINLGEHPDGRTPPSVEMDYLDLSERGHKGLGVTCKFTLYEGQSVSFVLREPPAPETSGVGREEECFPDNTSISGDMAAVSAQDPPLTTALLERLLRDTTTYWLKWLSKCTYKGRWREVVQRSALALKLLTFAPTGAIVAAPTFSLPEDLHGAGRNWDYRFSWLRDSAFTVYALLRLGFTEEADQYVDWLSGIMKNRNEDGSLQIMYTIHGGKHIPEEELHHLDGHKVAYDDWFASPHPPLSRFSLCGAQLILFLFGNFRLLVRELVDYVCKVWSQPDLSIWEVRGQRQNFLYSKIMCWVAVDRGLRLADKRSLPCPHRNKWLETRDAIYEEIQDKGYNKEKGFFAQSYENIDVLDSAVLIMPLTFFMSANDPRFTSTLKRIMQPRDRDGLFENNLVYRYDTAKVDDGTGGGEEGAFSMCSLWLVEALARAGRFDKSLLSSAVVILEDFIGYTNHLGLLSEEISKGGEPLGNFPQVSLISTVFNVDRATGGQL